MSTSRVQLALNVSDLERSVAFYRVLLGAEPAKVRPDYAKFDVADPPLVLSLQSTNDMVRYYAAVLLRSVHYRLDLTIPALTAALSDPRVGVQTAAANALSTGMYMTTKSGLGSTCAA